MRKFNKSRLIVSLIVAVALLILPGSSFAGENKEFSDLSAAHWAKEYIDTLVAKGGIDGYPDGTFKPSGTITNAEFVKITVGMLYGEQAKSGDGNWASGYFDKALEEQLISEPMDKEKQAKPMTRQEMAMLMSRAAEKALKEDMSVKDKERLIKEIRDYDSLCKFCKDDVIKVYAAGIITGYPDGTFKPDGTATRAEASAMLVRLIDKSKRQFRLDQQDYKHAKVVKTGSTSEYKVDANEDYIKEDCPKYVLVDSAAPYMLEKLPDTKTIDGRKTCYWMAARADLGAYYHIKDGKIYGRVAGDDLGNGKQRCFVGSGGHNKADYYAFEMYKPCPELGMDGKTDWLLIMPNPFK